MIVEMISKYAYELYKIDWKHSYGITEDKELCYIKDYYDGLAEENADEYYSYEEYIREFGYNGDCYVCYDEFLNYEYLDEKYIEELLDNTELIKLYRKDIKENFDFDKFVSGIF